jgi:hypothetical protein
MVCKKKIRLKLNIVKNQLVFLFLFSFSLFVNSQENVKTCNENQTSFNELIKDNKFDQANILVDIILKNCPTSATENFYLNAEKLYLRNIEFSKSNQEKIDIINNLIKIYDLFDKKFPENTNENVTKKAIFLYDNNIGTKKEVLAILENLFITKPKNFINPRAFYIYFEQFEKQFKEANSKLKIDDLISKNIEINQKNNDLQSILKTEIEQLSDKQKSGTLFGIENSRLISKTADLQAYQTIENATKGILWNYLNCENLNNYCINNFEKNKNNNFWLKFLTATMFEKACYSSQNFYNLALKSNELNATSKSNFYLGYACVTKNEIQNAEKYFNESADMEINISEKSKIYYTIATTVYGINDKLNASKFLKKAIQTDSKFGKPYLYLSQLYLSSIDECAKTEFEKKALFWLIASTVEKAGIAEDYLKSNSQKQMTDFLKSAPTKSDIVKSGKAGKTITFDCFINETINVPKK